MSLEGRMSAAEFRALPRTKRSKYRNVKTEYRGVTYDSKHEADVAAKIELFMLGGAIVRAERQVKYKLVVKKFKVATYVADFVVEWANGAVDVIDAKGFPTPTYRLKKRLMWALYGIKIMEL